MDGPVGLVGSGGDVHIGLDLGRALDVGVDIGQLIWWEPVEMFMLD